MSNDELLQLELKLEEKFKYLAILEINGKAPSLEFRKTLDQITELTTKETNLLAGILTHNDITRFQSLLKEFQQNGSTYLNRLINIIASLDSNDFLSDPFIEASYLNVLEEDIAKLTQIFLMIISNNPYFSPIKNELVFQRYLNIFANPLSTKDLVLENDHTIIELESLNFSDTKANFHIRRSLLVLDSILNIDALSLKNTFSKTDKKDFIASTFQIIDILVKSLLLYDKENLDIILERLNSLLESDFTSVELKELLDIMLSEFKLMTKRVKTPQDFNKIR